MADFFLKKLFYGIPSISCEFSELPKDNLGYFCLERNDDYDLRDEDELLADYVENAPEYKMKSFWRNGFGIDIVREPSWTDPLNRPEQYILISEKIRRKIYVVTGTLLHELTHYDCWHCGYDHKDGMDQFEAELKRRGLPSCFDREFKNGKWVDSYDYNKIKIYYDIYKEYSKIQEEARK